MNRKLVLLLVVTMIFSIFAFGCQNTAQRPLNPNQPNNTTPNNNPNMTAPNTTQNTLTDSEARELAERLANQAEEVDGVKRASVVVSDNMNGANNTTGNNNLNNNNNMGNNNLGTNRNGMTGNVGTNGNTGLNTGMTDGNPGLNRGTNNNGLTGTSNTGIINNTGTANNGIAGNNNNNMGNNTATNNNRGLVVMVGLELEDNNMNNASNMDNIQREVARQIKASDNRITQVYVTTDESLMGRIDKVASNIADGRTVNAVRTDIDNIFRSLTAKGPAF